MKSVRFLARTGTGELEDCELLIIQDKYDDVYADAYFKYDNIRKCEKRLTISTSLDLYLEKFCKEEGGEFIGIIQ